MRKFLLSLSILVSTISFAQTISYPGNGKNSFGGAVGLGTLSITDAGDTLLFSLQKGPGLFDSLLVFYIDEPSTTSGISSTGGLIYTGVPDKYSTAASGRFSSSQEARLDFPANFKPDLAVVFDKDGGRLFFLIDTLGTRFMQEQGSFPVFPTGNNSAPTYTAYTFKSQFGLLPTDTVNFNFMGTYIGQTAFRSNEGFGDPFTGYSRVSAYNPYTVQETFNFSTSAALPVSLVDFAASAQQGKIEVKWSVAQEINIDEYQLERSANGRDFATIASVKARNASGNTTYTSVDALPIKGNNYYRLRIKERGGSQVSRVIVIKNASLKSNFAVTQVGSALNIQMQDMVAGDYRLMVINNNGQLIQSTNIVHDGVDGIKQVDLKSTPSRGIYRVVLQSNSGSVTQSILLQ
ncbi:hypothetical protein [Aridibaculum aurantiacum]|uniref:hypothetical protein n=1 Tax=Aridibaculum aurantiacum TaxID=2810307 RepID=UPI001A972080|nr:hypothetical protein [Aridibaculum aurantiacum]